MNELTKEQRNVIYKKALKLFKTNEHCGLCSAIDAARFTLNFSSNYSPFHYMEENYPEIYKHKPTVMDDHYFWFPVHENDDVRISILEQAIAETETAI